MIHSLQPFAIAGGASGNLEAVVCGTAAHDMRCRWAVVAPHLTGNPLSLVAAVIDSLVASELRQGLVGEICPPGASVFGPGASVNRTRFLSATASGIVTVRAGEPLFPAAIDPVVLALGDH